MISPRPVVVWGNCQAAPLADLLRVPMAACGLTVVDVPPVYLADRRQLAAVHRSVRRAAYLISHPIREEYRFGGCGTAALASLLPSDGRLITVPTTFHIGPFPYLVNAHGADGTRVNAPLTDYHDLRAVVAASCGLDVAAATAWWPGPDVRAVRATNSESIEELRQRETGLDVGVSDLVAVPDSMWSMNHPSNGVLAEVARRVLAVVGCDGEVPVPTREYLGERRAPVDAEVAAGIGWPQRPDWTVQGKVLGASTVLAAHLGFYRSRPDVVADTVRRYAERIARLGLAQPSASARRSAPVSSA